MIDAEQQELKNRIALLVQEEERLGKKVYDPAEVPSRYELITPEWLTAAVGAGVPGACVVEFRLGAVDDGSANRRRIHLTWNETGRAAGLPETVFGKGSQGLMNRVMYAIVGSGRFETNFYNKVRRDLAIETPDFYLATYDPDSFNSILLLHDIADRADFCDYDTPIDLDRAKSMMTLLAGLHSTFYENERLEGVRGYFKTWPGRWPDLLRLGFEEYTDQGFGAAESVIPERLFRRRAEIWPATVKAVERHLSLPATLTHGDVHLKNWYVTKDGQMGLSDWQGPSIGHWSRDVAYAMCAGLATEDRRRWEKELVSFYLERLREGGVATPSDDEAWVLIRQQMFTALAYWTITLRPSPTQPDMQPEDATVSFIQRLATAIDDHQALDSFD